MIEQEPFSKTEINVRGVALHQLPLVRDQRGTLSVGEIGEHVPFDVQRYFLVYDVASEKIRGEHAHKHCHQFLVCISGALSVMVDDGITRQELVLGQKNQGLHIPPMVWGAQYNFTKDAVLLVLASQHFDDADYIRDYDSFLKAVQET